MRKEQEGITLIALIITIIVMLILVAVTINVVLNGGIFDKAKMASDQTQREADREELLLAVLGTANSRGELQIVTELENNLPDGWNPPVQSENNEYLQCKSQKNNIFFVNKETGEILDKLPTKEPEDDSPAGVTSFTFTVGDLVDNNAIFGEGGSIYIPVSSLTTDSETLSKLSSNKKAHASLSGGYIYDNVVCSDNTIINKSDENLISNFNDVYLAGNNRFYGLYTMENGETQMFLLVVALDVENAIMLTSSNASSYRDLSFTIPLQ